MSDESYKNWIYYRVFQILDKVNHAQERIDRLQQKIKELKKQPLEMVIADLSTVAPEEAWQWLDDLYWLDERLDLIVRKACLAVIGDSFQPSVQQIEYPCARCGKYTSGVCKSWRSRKAVLERSFCPGCRQLEWRTQQQRNSEQTQKFEDQYLIQQEVVRDLRALPYSEYLQTSHWQNLRKQKLQQAGHRCQLCNGRTPLHVHHRTYERRGQEWLSDLIALCVACHEKFHDITHKHTAAEEEV